MIIYQESIGRVLYIRKQFQEVFNSSSENKRSLDSIRPEDRKEFQEALKGAPLTLYSISDAVLIAVPLISDKENCAACISIYEALAITSGIGLYSLSIGVPIRGGLSVGVATQIDEREIYGPALVSAVHLENKLAEYPQFLVGREVIDYLELIENQEPKTRVGRGGKAIAKSCREIIIQDTDGRYMLDFLQIGIDFPKFKKRGVVR